MACESESEDINIKYAYSFFKVTFRYVSRTLKSYFKILKVALAS
jgi:hypothetical protein